MAFRFSQKQSGSGATELFVCFPKRACGESSNTRIDNDVIDDDRDGDDDDDNDDDDDDGDDKYDGGADNNDRENDDECDEACFDYECHALVV